MSDAANRQSDLSQFGINDRPVVIETKNLQLEYGDVVAIKNFSLTIYRGEMFGIVGPDSAGKSTLIRVLCGLLKPSRGLAKVLGFNLAIESQKVKERIGYLSQEFTLYGDLTVDENIEFFARLHSVRNFEERREYLLKFTRLERFRNRLAQNLSGGMKKKLALACTLIHTPEIIFLDEPSTGVDPVSRGELWNILSGILKEGVTIVMTTPYLDEAERCQRVALMYRGELFVADRPEKIKSEMPGKVYDIICHNPQMAYHRLRKRFSPLRLVLYGERLRLWTEDEGEVHNVVKMIEGEMGAGCSFEVGEPTLEDAFVAYTMERNSVSN
ncbi:MAG: ABC transporter ATP-binding protein [Verrucomicrobiia bacterium]